MGLYRQTYDAPQVSHGSLADAQASPKIRIGHDFCR
jgi:hypothetical protein